MLILSLLPSVVRQSQLRHTALSFALVDCSFRSLWSSVAFLYPVFLLFPVHLRCVPVQGHGRVRAAGVTSDPTGSLQLCCCLPK